MAKLVLHTAIADAVLYELGPADAQALFDLMQANRAHLTALGDFTEQLAASAEAIANDLRTDRDRHTSFGILMEDRLVGRVDLLGVEPPRYGLGYWLAASHNCRGIATAAVRAVVAYAFAQRCATGIFAGVTHGNVRSARLLQRLAFRPIQRFDTYTRFHRAAAHSEGT